MIGNLMGEAVNAFVHLGRHRIDGKLLKRLTSECAKLFSP